MVNRGRRSKSPLCANCGKAIRLRLRVKMCRPMYLRPAVKNTRLTSKKRTLLARQQWVQIPVLLHTMAPNGIPRRTSPRLLSLVQLKFFLETIRRGATGS
ncbi:hypothetical protein TcCL_NonESM10569 [Trypanosoma cruzi]|nr:hypothetical protein TcCL_NonESM10569 [Trypanosoma cruzi]